MAYIFFRVAAPPIVFLIALVYLFFIGNVPYPPMIRFLMAVGAGLRLGALREGPHVAAGLLTIRHALLPGIGLVCAFGLGLPPVQQTVIVLFSALPTASSAYVLAVRMGGHGPYVAGLVTLSTLLGMASLPLAMVALELLR